MLGELFCPVAWWLAPWFGSGEASDGADLKLGLSSSTGGLW